MSQDQTPARPTVLVVEDEPLLLMDSVDIVEEAGYQVLQAPNADEAIKILTANTDIGIVFTDIHMPGSLDGLKLAHFIRNRWPPIHLILASGQTKPEAAEMPSRVIFLSKPFEPEQLRAALLTIVR